MGFIFPKTPGWTPCICCIFAVRRQLFSHETALFFHDLTDREPLAYSITVKTGYNPTPA